MKESTLVSYTKRSGATYSIFRKWDLNNMQSYNHPYTFFFFSHFNLWLLLYYHQAILRIFDLSPKHFLLFLLKNIIKWKFVLIAMTLAFKIFFKKNFRIMKNNSVILPFNFMFLYLKQFFHTNYLINIPCQMHVRLKIYIYSILEECQFIFLNYYIFTKKKTALV